MRKGILFVVLAAAPYGVHAELNDWEITSEIGIGYKLSTSADVLMPDCSSVVNYPLTANPIDYTFDYQPGDDVPFSIDKCGGNYAAFIGWPIAFERDFGKEIGTLKVGWFHYSNWFADTEEETHMDAISVSGKLNWSRLFEHFKQKRAEREFSRALERMRDDEPRDWDNRIKIPQ